METTDRKALTFAAVLHALLLGGILFVAEYGASHAESHPSMVMEMFAPPSTDDAAQMSIAQPPAEAPLADPAPSAPEPESQAEPPAEPPAELLRQPDIAPLEQQSFETLSKVPPLPEPEPEPSSTPAPEPSKPAPAKPKPAAKPPVEPSPAKPPQQMMTAEQFRKQIGLPKQARSPASQTQRQSPTTTTNNRNNGPVKIDTSGVTKSLQSFLASGDGARATQMSASDQSALLAYLGRLRSNIHTAWQFPQSVANAGEWAEVLITIEADGRISSVRIGKHSGSKAFLESIERAVRSARSVGPPPSRQRQQVRYTFNLRDM